MLLLSPLILSLLLQSVSATDNPPSSSSSLRTWDKPIILDRSGGFSIAAKTIRAPYNRNETLTCDWGYLEYFIPWTPRKTSLVMWHSASTQAFQNRWDGGQGFKDMFLRRGYPVYFWEGPRVGRANWACERYTYVPEYRDKGNFNAWNFGPVYPNWWPGVQFPEGEKREEAWAAATRTRYVEFDTYDNVLLHAHAAAVAADSGRLGDSIVYLTNSNSGLRALYTAMRTNSTNIKGVVAYEPYYLVFPSTANITGPINGDWGPFVEPVANFKKLAKVPAIQFVWGDNRSWNETFVANSRKVAEWINFYGGNAQVFMLNEHGGLKGNTHTPFADMNNEEVAGLLEGFLGKYKLDRFHTGRWPHW